MPSIYINFDALTHKHTYALLHEDSLHMAHTKEEEEKTKQSHGIYTTDKHADVCKCFAYSQFVDALLISIHSFSPQLCGWYC